MTKAILLNGPPRSGKDYIGKALWNAVLPMGEFDKFAKPIVDYMLFSHGIDMEKCEKDAPHPSLFGKTPREVAIAYSERMCKPVFGLHYFGIKAVDRLRARNRRDQIVIFTDSGFAIEAVPLVQEIGAQNVLQVRVSRPGRTFEGDSRSYWSLPDVHSIEFVNDQDGRGKITNDLVPEVLKWCGC